jgi:hypothetical protein
MPYFVHPKDTEVPAESTPYASRQEAHGVASKTEGSTVTFQISEDERSNWRAREYHRFRDGVYALPPWIASLSVCWRPGDYEDRAYQYQNLAHHFAHLSLKSPGCIAYTPSDEHGHQDRQTTIKVGKYLEAHARDYFTAGEIARFVELVKGYTSGLQLARTAEEIEKVYRNGPNSCMSHERDEYSCDGHHPTEVYGDSDLALAYLGTVDDVSARALVWPDEKLYSRVYGDRTLTVVLESEGYTCRMQDHDYGVFHGAKIRAIKLSRGRYVMPYLDCATGATLDRDGKTFTLHGDSGEEEYAIYETDGVSRELHRSRCDHCGERCDSDAMYCDSCRDDLYSCSRCDTDHFDSSDGEMIGDDWYCDSCIDSHYRHECDSCSDSWIERDPDSEYCPDCREHYTDCHECGDMHDTRDSNDPSSRLCDSCYVPEEDEDETAEETSTPSAVGTYTTTDRYPVIDETIRVWKQDGRGGGTWIDVVPNVVRGALAIHAKVDEDANDPPFVISHIPTGLLVMRVSYGEADRLLEMLTTPGMDWGFTRQEDCKQTVRECALYIVRYRCLPPPSTSSAYAAYVYLTHESAEVSCPL